MLLEVEHRETNNNTYNLSYRAAGTQLGAQFLGTGTGLCPDVDPRPTHAAACEPMVQDAWLPPAQDGRVYVVRVEVQADQLVVELKAAKQGRTRDGMPPHHESAEQGAQCTVLCIPWRKTPSKRCREIIVPKSPAPQDARPIRAETRAKLVASIARGRRWLDESVTGAGTSIEQIAARENCSVRQVNMTISLAFLAPNLVQAAVEGRLPRGIGVARLRDAPAEWSRQYAMLGLSG